MPAYYSFQLYKNPEELCAEEIIRATIQSLLDVGCEYKFVTLQSVVDDSLPRDHQRIIFSQPNFALAEATEYAIHDVEIWRTHKRHSKFWAGITMVFDFDFDFDFQFDAEILARTGSGFESSAKQVQLRFRVEEDFFCGNRVTVALNALEDELMDGQPETSLKNKTHIFQMLNGVAVKICPHFCWSDWECGPGAESYKLLESGKWPAINDMVIIGPQLIAKVAHFSPETTPSFAGTLTNGSIILRREVTMSHT